MPEKKGYKHKEGFNIPLTTKGPIVEKCLAECYPALRKEGPLSADTPENKRIAAAICHKRCG
jgi:hypothetical protein